MRKRTASEEQIRQLKIIVAQMAPMGVFVRIAFYLFAFLCTMGLLASMFLPKGGL
jgi:hypothetical protein